AGFNGRLRVAHWHRRSAGQPSGGPRVSTAIRPVKRRTIRSRTFCKDVTGMLLNRDDWYETSRDLDWTLSYVDENAAFPTAWTGSAGIPQEAWQAWEEPFRVSYRDYVRIQREKESGVKAVSNALARSGTYAKLDPAHVAASHLHMGTTCMVEYMAVTMQS